MKKIFILIQIFATIVLASSCKNSYELNVGKSPKRVLPKDVYERLAQKYIYIGDFYDGMAVVAYEDYEYGFAGRSGYIDTKGDEVIPAQWADAGPFCDGLAYVGRSKSSDCYGYINKKGEYVLPLQYSRALSFYNGHGIVNKGGQDYTQGCSEEGVFFGGSWFVIDKKGRTESRINYDAVSGFLGDGLILVARVIPDGEKVCTEYNFKYGIINESGKEIVPLKYSEISRFNNESIIIFDGKKYGLLDNMCKEVLACEYDKIIPIRNESSSSEFTNDFLLVCMDNKCGLINAKGEIIQPYKYDEITPLDASSKLSIRIGSKWGLLSGNGKVFLPCVYDDRIMFDEKKGTFSGVKDSKQIEIDSDGHEKIIGVQFRFNYKTANNSDELIAHSANINRTRGYHYFASQDYVVPKGESWTFLSHNIKTIIGAFYTTTLYITVQYGTSTTWTYYLPSDAEGQVFVVSAWRLGVPVEKVPYGQLTLKPGVKFYFLFDKFSDTEMAGDVFFRIDRNNAPL